MRVKEVAAVVLFVATMQAKALVPVQASAVVTDTDSAGTGDWIYRYTLTNTSSCGFTPTDCAFYGVSGSSYGHELAIHEFDVQIFDDSDIASIASPSGWMSTIVAGDGDTATLVWTSSASAYDLQYQYLGVNSLSGFGFTSEYGLGKGTFSTLNSFNDIPYIGDPAIPLSPDAIAAGIQPLTSAVPEPAEDCLLLAGLGALAIAGRKRKA